MGQSVLTKMNTMTLTSAAAKGSKGLPARSNAVTAGEGFLAVSTAGDADDVPPGEFPPPQPAIKKTGSKTRMTQGFWREDFVGSVQAIFCPQGSPERWGDPSSVAVLRRVETPSRPGIRVGDGESGLDGSLAPP